MIAINKPLTNVQELYNIYFMKKFTPPKEALLPIREVAKITGINPITLRAWERRYRLIEPIRTESGHRLYTDDNIDTLKKVIRLNQQGVPISQIKSLLEKQQIPEIKPQSASDLEIHLYESIETLEINSVNQLVDHIMADNSIQFWLPLFARITRKLPNTEPTGNLWFSLMLPRLMSRLHLSYRHLNKNLRPIWVQCAPKTNELTAILSALTLVSKGYFPLIQPKGDMDFKELRPTLLALHCHGVAWVNSESSSTIDEWRHWTNAHPSFELFLFLNQPDSNEFGQPQVQLFDITDLETEIFDT